MADLMEYVNVLADQIGPRPVSTEEEHQASMYIAQELSEEGLDVSVDEFATPSGVRWPYVIAYAAAALGTIISGIGIFVPGISLSMFIIGLILVAGGLFIYFTENNNQPILSKMRASGVSQNVVAKYVPENLARESRRRKIIIAAHVDTVRVQPEASPKIIGHMPLLHKIVLYCMIGLVAVLFVRLLPLPWPEVIDNILWGLSLVASLYVLLWAGCIIASHFTPYISGGNDNASSIAVLLSVAHLLANPNDRARYARGHTTRFDLDGAVFANDYAEGDYDDYVGSEVESMDFDEEGDLVMHSAEEAEDLNLDYMSEGAELTYDDDGMREDATVAYSALSPEQQLDVLSVTAAEELHYDAMATGTFSLDDVELDDVDGAVAQINPNNIADMEVPDLDFNLDEEIDHASKEPVERAEDAVVFAEYMSQSKDEQEKPADELQEIKVVDMRAEKAEEPESEAQIEAEAEAHEEVDEEPPAPAPVYMPIETLTRDHADEQPQVARPVPSWYAAAKEKAAKDLEKKAKSHGADEEPVLSYRSRFADSPAIMQNEHRDDESRAEQAQQEPEPRFDDERPAASEPVVAEAVEEEAVVVAEESPESEAVYPVEEVLETQEANEPIDLEISDDELDELSPDASGLFARIEVDEETHHDSRPESRKPITSRIPNIGSSDDRMRTERKAAQQNRAARGSRPELQGIPGMEDDGFQIVESGLSFMDENAYEAAAAVEPVVPAARPQRKKPTARHITQQFVPTRASHRDIQLGGDRQEAPVSSRFESTPQATPADDPFAPKSEEPVNERTSARPAPRQRTEYASATYSRTDEVIATPASTSSFPALTGSFPALSGSMPVIDASDFSDSGSSVVADDAALDSFMAADHGTELNIPDSRFRNAVDKVGGLFNRKGKDAQEGYAGSDSDAWSDEDDYGWKGGGYIEQEAESAFDAVRQRAAQIRDSVVSMTERDLLDKEVWFVALGASGAGAQGMKNFLDLHSSELRGSLIINLEAVGAGTISYVDSEGTGKPRRADRRLMSLVKRASKEIHGSEMKSKSLDWRNTDATPAMIAGMRALTIMGFADNGVAPVDWHTAADTAAIVEENKLDYMTNLLLKVIENS